LVFAQTNLRLSSRALQKEIPFFNVKEYEERGFLLQVENGKTIRSQH
jgi:hypothetical protein